MWSHPRAIGAALSIVLLWCGAARAEDPFDTLVFEEARKRAPALEDLMRRARAASEAQQLPSAIGLYDEALLLAPDFEHALRRKCGLELALERTDEAEVSCRAALSANRSALNLASLAAVTLKREDGQDDARRMLSESLDIGSHDTPTLEVATRAALDLQDAALTERAAHKLRVSEPGTVLPYYALGIAAAMREDYNDARDLLAQARDRGLPGPVYDSIISKIDEAQPFVFRVLPKATHVGLAWLGALLLFLVIGSILSAATLSAALRLPKQVGGAGDGVSTLLRRSYAGLLWLSCLFYYLSLPLLVIAIVGMAAAIVYGFLAVGRIPIKLVLIVAAGACISVWAVLKSLFVRTRDEDPGTALDLEKEPAFRGLLDEVAAKVGTRAVDRVFLTPGTDIAVFERGDLGAQLRGHSERCLVLGLGVLEGMRISDFKAILAHEYGHFSNRDTAGGGFSLGVRRSMIAMARSLAEGGAATWYNPAWWFFNAFYRIFLRISQGASRLQEILADRWAAFSYGSEAFVRGFEHVIARSVLFDAQADVAVDRAREAQRPLTNFYSFLREQSVHVEQALVSASQEEALQRQPSPYDSHPAPRDRIAWVKALAIPEPETTNHAEVWTLFAGRETLEREMTNTVNELLGLHARSVSPLD